MEHFDYIRLPLAIVGQSIKREVVLAERGNTPNEFYIRSIPAFVYGTALNDLVQISNEASGLFEVLIRSGQITLRVFIDGRLERTEIEALVSAVIAKGGRYEVAKNDVSNKGNSMLLLSIDLSIGFKNIEEMMRPIERAGAQWEYGNVYDASGKPMNWWMR